MTGTLAPSVTATAQRCAQVLAEVERVIVGKREAVAQVLLGILASGHILIEDLPGLGKTLLARTFATTLGLEFTRVQFTPDMLPSDLTGAPMLDPRTGRGGVPAAGRCSPTCCSATRSTARRRRRRPPCWRPWLRARSAWTAGPTRCRSRSSCSRPTTRSSTRAPTRSPRRSLTGSWPGSGWATWTRRARRRWPGAGWSVARHRRSPRRCSTPAPCSPCVSRWNRCTWTTTCSAMSSAWSPRPGPTRRSASARARAGRWR